jgi:hypothetical protein
MSAPFAVGVEVLMDGARWRIDRLFTEGEPAVTLVDVRDGTRVDYGVAYVVAHSTYVSRASQDIYDEIRIERGSFTPRVTDSATGLVDLAARALLYRDKREALIEAAATIVAAIELIDAQAAAQIHGGIRSHRKRTAQEAALARALNDVPNTPEQDEHIECDLLGPIDPDDLSDGQ